MNLEELRKKSQDIAKDASKLRKEREKILKHKIEVKENTQKYITCPNCQTRYFKESYSLLRNNQCSLCHQPMLTKARHDKFQRNSELLEKLKIEHSEIKKLISANLNKLLKNIKNDIERSDIIESYYVGDFNEDLEMWFRTSKYAQHESYGSGEDYRGDRAELFDVVKKIVNRHLPGFSHTCYYGGEKEYFCLELELK